MLEQHSYPQGLSIWAFDMIEFERVVFLDPFALVLENVDELFACSGYCASLHSKGSPVVLEPSLKTFTSLARNFRKSDETDFILNLQSIMNLESCSIFSQDMVVDLEVSDHCLSGDSNNLLSECHQLTVEYGALSGGFAAQHMYRDLVCTTCGLVRPKIIMYPRNDDTYESFMKTKKAIVSKWDSVRSKIPISDRMRNEGITSFTTAASVILFVLYFVNKRSFPSTDTPLCTPPPSRGTSLVFESISCTPTPLQDPNTNIRVIANRSSLYLFTTVLMTVFVTSVWYNLALIFGLYSSSFEWDPLASLAVGYMWSTLFLLTGMQLIDYCFDLFNNNSHRLFRELILFVVVWIAIFSGIAWEHHYFHI
jgi:hypothetical protein